MSGVGPAASLSLVLSFAACGPAAKPAQRNAVEPVPARAVPTDTQPDAGRARAGSAPIAGWNTVESQPCRGLATTSSEDALTGEPRGALSLRSHRVRAVIAGGLSRTEVVEELVNEAPRAVEARFSFVLPGGASVSGVSLLRGKTWREAELVDSDRIAAIPRGRAIEPFDHGSVARDDGDAFVARIIGFAAKQRRSLRLAYDGTVERSASREIYRYPISLSPCASAPLPEVSIEVVLAGAPGTYDKIETPNHPSEVRTEPDRVIVSLERGAVVRDQDFTVEFERRRESVEILTDFAETDGNQPRLGHVLLTLALPAVASAGQTNSRASTARVVVLDKSYSQSSESLALQGRVVEHVLGRAAANERTSLLACDSACAAWSPDQPNAPDPAREAGKWLRTLAPGGTFDLEGALFHAALLLERSERKQLVFFGNGRVSSGTRDRAALVARVAQRLARRAIDLRVFGVGPRQDETMLFELAAAARGSYSTLSDTVPIEHSAAELLASVRAPKLTDVTLELPGGLQDPLPARWPALVMGQTLRVAARTATSLVGTLRVAGKLDGRDYAASYPVSVVKTRNGADPSVARFWAREWLREAARDVAGLGAAFGESELARSAGVASGHTDWLLLEAGPHSRGVFPERSAAGLPAPSTFASLEGRPSPRLTPRVRIGVSPATYRDGVASPEHAARRQRDVSLLVSVLRRCYEQHATTGGEWFEGRLAFMLRVGPFGSFESLAADAEPARDVRALIACMRAGAARLTYEPPASRTGEIRFSAELAIRWSEGMIVRYPVPDAPVSQGALSTAILAGDEQWRKLSPRTERERRVRAVLDAPASEMPYSAALRGAEGEPRSAAALDLLAVAAGAHDRSELLTAALEAQLALDPDQPELRRRLARAWLRAGDERRACAHVRALGAPPLTTIASASALCRKRWLDEHGPPMPAPASDEAAEQILGRALDAPAPEPSCQPFTVAVSCEGRERCPAPLVLTPGGEVISAFGRIPGSGKAEPLSFWPTTFGTYRILLFGGAPGARGMVELAAHVESARFSFQRAGISQTVASVDVQPEPPEGLAIGLPLCGKRD